jgi:hypothetical protein
MDSSGDTLIVWAEREFQFDGDDLIANRQGVMSKKQRERTLRGGASLIFTTLVGGGLALAWLVFDALGKEHFLGVLSVVVKGLAIFTIFGVFALMGWRFRKAGSSAIVKSIRSTLNVVQEKKNLYLRVGSSDIRFEVEPEVKDLVFPDKEYRFYYSEINKTILSVEEI